MKKKITLLLSTYFFFFLPFIGKAQPGFDDVVNDVPVDGGLSLLVAAGVGYAANKYKRKKK